MLLFLAACSDRVEQHAANDRVDTAPGLPPVQPFPQDRPWYDPIVENYIRNATSPLIVSGRKEKNTVQEWLLDRTDITDSAHYFIFQIGRDVAEEDGSEPRFATDGWIWIDSISRQVYEYDIAADSLMKWPR
jgi:hypothetical protein